MRPALFSCLVNGDAGDPALFTDLQFRNDAILFDMGDLSFLPSKKMLRVSSVYISHAHMDHFIGFDRFLRVSFGRMKSVRIYGPEGISGQVGAKLSAYTWNLAGSHLPELSFIVNEIRGDVCLKTRYSSRNIFRGEFFGEEPIEEGILHEDPCFRVSHVRLDHGISSLAFSVEEKFHVNIWKSRLQEMGLSVGPWLRSLKDAVLKREPDDTMIETPKGRVELGNIRPAARIVPGQKIAYVTDAACTPENLDRMIRLADCADILYIEAMFLEKDRAHSESKRHLTAWQAGKVGKLARAKSVVPFHFSPRYSGREDLLREEARRAFMA